MLNKQTVLYHINEEDKEFNCKYFRKNLATHDIMISNLETMLKFEVRGLVPSLSALLTGNFYYLPGNEEK